MRNVVYAFALVLAASAADRVASEIVDGILYNKMSVAEAERLARNLDPEPFTRTAHLSLIRSSDKLGRGAADDIQLDKDSAVKGIRTLNHLIARAYEELDQTTARCNSVRAVHEGSIRAMSSQLMALGAGLAQIRASAAASVPVIGMKKRELMKMELEKITN